MSDVPSATVVATLSNVAFGYSGAAGYLLTDASLDLRAEEIVMLTGPNGCGKSTMLGLLTGRLAPIAGTVRVLEEDPCRCSRVPSIGLVTEPFHPDQSPLPVNLTIREVVRWLKVLDPVSPTALDALLEELRLDSKLQGRVVRSLSKGERQRVMLLVLLARQPHLVLADEPLEGIDQESRQVIGQSLRRYATSRKATVVWVSHYVSEAAQLADRVFEITAGKLVECTEPEYEVQLLPESSTAETHRMNGLAWLPGTLREILAGSSSVHVQVSRRDEGDSLA
tara:strand:+ start:1949 stop:2791 length:843 start_codon:yes stop_codon:yes gene_type:complete